MGRRFGGVAGAVLIVLLWTVLALTAFRASGAVPTPLAVLRQYGTDGFAFYWHNMSVTLRGALLGFGWGNALGIAIALVALLLPRFEGVAAQLAVISYCIPLTAIGPVILVVQGGRAPTVFLAGMSVFFTTLVGALLGLKAADETSLDLIRAYGGGRWRQLVKVRIMAALPATFGGLQIAAPTALLGAILGEYLGGVDNGIGVALTASQQSYQVARTWGLALACGVVAGAGYLAIGFLGRLLTPWSGPSRQALAQGGGA
ncbi:ABC transporter permease [Amycolatopsis alkalitolerans]|uniref:ABC transporter permease subunit n=1 Tax=Amycolatopsis alkalitolerans TaxID=2547244 RepID=A0A5C4LTE3_9PSEU|nr:ABC transporter permease subunit [Amycolatopsis alkalitolerans]TNC20457.1 ABC transporter permease subunit [Amycolatopsis alkalitolerans]